MSSIILIQLLTFLFLINLAAEPLRPSTIDAHHVCRTDFMKLCWLLKVDPLEILPKELLIPKISNYNQSDYNSGDNKKGGPLLRSSL